MTTEEMLANLPPALLAQLQANAAAQAAVAAAVAPPEPVEVLPEAPYLAPEQVPVGALDQGSHTGDGPKLPPKKRTRRTKAEMEAARAEMTEAAFELSNKIADAMDASLRKPEQPELDVCATFGGGDSQSRAAIIVAAIEHGLTVDEMVKYLSHL